MNQILNMVNEQKEFLWTLDLKTEAQRLEAASNAFQNKAFRVLITGEYGRGKSTFLNALLGKEIFRASLLRVPIVNVIKGSEKKSAQAGQPESLKAIELDAILDAEDVNLVELNWNADFLKEGMLLVEYPSMNESPDPAAFIAEVEQADLIVMAVACDSLYSITEADIYKNLLLVNGHKKPLFVANFLDRIASKDLDEVTRAALIRLPVNQDRIFFVSAQNALDGDSEAKSMIEGFQNKLVAEADNREVLKSQRLREVALVGLGKADTLLEVGNNQATEKQEQADLLIQDVRKRLKIVQDVSLRTQRDLNDFRDSTRDIIQEKIGHFLQDMQFKIEEWGRDYSGSNPATYLNGKLKSTLTDFVERDLKGFLNIRVKEQENLLNNGFQQYQQGLERLYALLPSELPKLEPLDALTLTPDVVTLQADTSDNTGGFNPRSLIEVPEAVITLLGATVGSILFSQLAVVIIPVGLGVSYFLALNGQRSKAKKSGLTAYAIQIQNQGNHLEVKIMEQINAAMNKMQIQVTQLLNSTTSKAQSDTNAHIKLLQDDMTTNGKQREQLELFRKSWENDFFA